MSPIYTRKLKALGCELWIKGIGANAVCTAVFDSIKDCWKYCDVVEKIAMESDSNWTIDVLPRSILNNSEGMRRATEDELLSY